jgi:hypothetical protein
VLSGNREVLAKPPMTDLLEILAATLTGMTVDELQAEVQEWLEAARDPRWKRPYTELAYLPIQELPDTRIGTFTQALCDEAQNEGWPVIRMKKDWKRIFPFE